MTVAFDITEDELPIFLADSDDQLQILDEGLVRLEREADNPELLQALFRAAHTLKGSAGMIGHKRMVEVTHALENVLDALRKEKILVTVELIDTCLESVDALHWLCEEITQGETNPAEISHLVEDFLRFASVDQTDQPPDKQGKPLESAAVEKTVSGKQVSQEKGLTIRGTVSTDSIASSARIFQVMMALQETGEIVSMIPDQARIETAVPVFEFTAQFIPSTPIEEVLKVLTSISEIEEVRIEEQAAGSQPETQPSVPSVQEAQKASRLGQLLVNNGLISETQLQTALQEQEEWDGPTSPLGETLVKMGVITQEVLDQVLVEQTKPVQQAAEAAAAKRVPARVAEKTVRTSVERLDALMNLVGELITDRNRLNLIRGGLEARFRGDDQIETLSETITHVGRITDQLQAEVMGIRMLPMSNVFNKFPRLVRDLARKAGKQVDLVIRGQETELDRSVIEEISDPLIHLLRNSVDHGLESPEERRATGKPERGIVNLNARQEQGRIIITVEDNGRGIDLERVKAKAVEKGLLTESEAESLSDEQAIDLIFLSGLSTAKVVSDVSGRGVGMDIVRNNIEHLGGTVMVETWPGRGSQFQIVLPLTLAILPTLLVRVGSATYAIPLVTITETLRVSLDSIETVNNRPVITLRDRVLPIMRLSDVFAIQGDTNSRSTEFVVVVRAGKTQLGLIVDILLGEEEVVVKSLSSVFGDSVGVSSAAILGDGKIALILDVQGLFKLASIQQYSR